MGDLLQEGCKKTELEAVLSDVLEDSIAFESEIKSFDEEAETFIATWQGTGLEALTSGLYGAGLDGGDIFDILTQYTGGIAGYLQGAENVDESAAEGAAGIGGK